MKHLILTVWIGVFLPLMVSVVFSIAPLSAGNLGDSDDVVSLDTSLENQQPKEPLSLLDTNNLKDSGLPTIYPGEKHMGMAAPVTPIAKRIVSVHNEILWIIGGIVLFVLLLMTWVVFRYNHYTHKKPATFSHNVAIEIVWTVIPVFILIFIASRTMGLLFEQADLDNFEPDLVVKITGNQWFWSYEYPDSEYSFDSFMLSKEQLKERGIEKKFWKLAVDNPLVVPINKNILAYVTSADVIHSWSVSAFGVKIDAIPGRLNQTWFRIEKPGIYYGHCYELCGPYHSYMPVMVVAVSENQYTAWIKLKSGKDEMTNDESFILSHESANTIADDIQNLSILEHE